jgi:acyl dehydratase
LIVAAEIVGRSAAPQAHAFTDRDALLYALALGFGSEPDAATLPFVYERDLKTVPTLPTVLAWTAEPTFSSLGAHPDFALHSGQTIEIHAALTPGDRLAIAGQVIAVHDKGRERGALIVMRQQLTRAENGERIATMTTSCFARDGGGGGSGGDPVAAPHEPPKRAPDHQLVYRVRPDAALLYRLTGDRNPLHADPAAARACGFAQPILHGLCTFGMTCRAVLECIAAWQPELVVSHEARFAAPVYPGETLEIDLWQDAGTVSFQATVRERGMRVLTNGKAIVKS